MSNLSVDLDAVAVVLVGRNEGERLRVALEAALRTAHKLVYVDSASTDGSLEIARGFGVVTVLLPPGEDHNAAKARNFGFAEVRRLFPECRYVQFVDGDCKLIAGWLEQAAGFLDAHPKAAVACGRRFEAFPNASVFNRLIDSEWATPIGRALACGGDSLVRVEAFEAVGGFRPVLKAGEEPEMSARLRERGWEVWRLDAQMTEHDAKLLRFDQWWSRCVRGGFGYAQAWSLTSGSRERVFARQLVSAAFWVLLLPAFVMIAAVAFGEPLLLLLIPLLYAVQIARIARRDWRSAAGWQRGTLIMLAKVAETVGALSFFLGKKPAKLRDYKAAAQ